MADTACFQALASKMKSSPHSDHAHLPEALFFFNSLVEYYSHCSPFTSSSFTSQQNAAPISPLQMLFYLPCPCMVGFLSLSTWKLQRLRLIYLQAVKTKDNKKGKRKETPQNARKGCKSFFFRPDSRDILTAQSVRAGSVQAQCLSTTVIILFSFKGQSACWTHVSCFVAWKLRVNNIVYLPSHFKTCAECWAELWVYFYHQGFCEQVTRVMTFYRLCATHWAIHSISGLFHHDSDNS